MSCQTCSALQREVEAAAHEFSLALRQSHTAIAPISGVVAGNRIEDSERALRIASHALDMHRQHCTNK
ncbi:MAG TPA: hypothetical protein VFU86_19935 [Terriglobales bacterium]|nr:hypothetical protein [Terriglobales bacterium]